MNTKITKFIVLVTVLGGLIFSTSSVKADTRFEEFKKMAEERAEQAKERVEKIREEAKERIKNKREEVEQKISKLRDQKKKDSALKINNQLDNINQIWTNHFLNVLNRLDEVLQKIASRTEKASANGKDVANVKIAIQTAVQKIATARTAVENQAKKTYLVDTTAISQADQTSNDQSSLVSKLREQFKIQKDLLKADLTALRDGLIKEARQAVKSAFEALSQVPNVDEEPQTSN